MTPDLTPVLKHDTAVSGADVRRAVVAMAATLAHRSANA